MVVAIIGQRALCMCGTKEALAEVMEMLIEEEGANAFILSRGSHLDYYSQQVLCDLKKKYPEVRSTFLWSDNYYPDAATRKEIALNHDEYRYLPPDDSSDTDRQAACGIYMVDRCDTLITYYGERVVEFGWGTSNAKISLDYAKKKLKRIINIYDLLKM